MKKFEFFKKNPKTGRVRAGAFYVINGMYGITHRKMLLTFSTKELKKVHLLVYSMIKQKHIQSKKYEK